MATSVTSIVRSTLSSVSTVPLKDIHFKCTNDYTGKSIKRLYHADNLDVLSCLVKDTDVCGKVDLVYIDPPYNTGGAFETRDLKPAYNDNFTTEGYLRFMEVRLDLLHKLLSNEGSIYIQLDSNMLFHVKLLMDKIFGEKNFRGMITRKKCKSKNFTRNTYGNISDYILFYGKGDTPKWNRPFEDWCEEKSKKEYPFIEEGTGRRYKKVPCHAPGTRRGATGGPWRGMMPPKGKHWQYTPDTLDEMDAKGEIYWSSNGNPRRKVYLDQSKGIPVQDIWLDFLDVNNQNTHQTGYPTEKNLDMLKRIVEASSNPGDLVLDCFAGSGTTLVAAEELGRQWIGIDIGDEAIRVIKDRFANGTKPLGDYVSKKRKVSAPSFFDEISIEEKNTEAISKPEYIQPKYQIFEEI